MLRLLGQAFQLFFVNILLFAAVVLTTAVPTSFFVRGVLAQTHGPERIYALLIMLPVVLAVVQISAGAVVHLVSELKRGRRATYAAAMMTGLTNWGRLLLTNAVVLVFVMLGLVALVVPGILFCVLYALIDPVVVLEHAGPTQAMRRSIELTEGRRWPILGIVILAFAVYAGSRLLEWGLLEPVASLNTLWIKTAKDCLVTVLHGVIQVTLILFYLEARAREATQSPVDDVDSPERCHGSTVCPET